VTPLQQSLAACGAQIEDLDGLTVAQRRQLKYMTLPHYIDQSCSGAYCTNLSVSPQVFDLTNGASGICRSKASEVRDSERRLEGELVVTSLCCRQPAEFKRQSRTPSLDGRALFQAHYHGFAKGGGSDSGRSVVIRF
jgi:hypothetical protein